MRSRGSESSTSIILVVMILFYVVLLAVIIVFFQQILLNISSNQSIATIIGAGVIIVLPLFLLAIIVYNLVKLLRERSRRRSGARFKTRLLLFFSLVALLSAVPQASLSVILLNSIVNSQLIDQLNDVLQNSWQITLDYYQSKVNNLTSFASHPILASLCQGIHLKPSLVWKNIQSLNPELQFCQVFSAEGRELFFSGDPEARNTLPDEPDNKAGLLPKLEKNNITLIRYLYIYKGGEQKYYLIFGITLPASFEEQAELLSDSRELFYQLFQFKDLVQVGIILFYFYFSFPVLLISIIISFFLSEEIIRPIISLEEATRQVAEGNLSIRILSRPQDEFSNLINSFNIMVEELEVARQKIQKTEKISAWQEIAQRLAHEIKNPLTPIRLSAERILKKWAADAPTIDQALQKLITDSIQAILKEVENLDKMLKEFNNFAKLPEPHFQKVNLNEFITDLVQSYANTQEGVIFKIEELPGNLTIKADPQQLKQALTNLIVNSLQAMPQGGTIFFRVDLVKKEKRNYCRIRIRDTGEGIDESDQPFIFTPYFTTKKDGTGLGLSIVERIVFDHKGNIWFESQKGIGTIFYLDVPME